MCNTILLWISINIAFCVAGGETAGMYADADLDLTGFARGAVNREKLLTQKNTISKGDSVNPCGYPIVRKEKNNIWMSSTLC